LTAACRTAVILLAMAAGAEAIEAPRVTPATVEMGAFYSGIPVRVQGAVAAGSRVIVAVRGVEKDELFNRKRQFGPIWITSGRVHVKGAPSLWMVYSAEPVRHVLPRTTIDRLALDSAGIESRMRIEPEEADLPVLRRHYLAWKRQQGLYSENPSSIRTIQAAGDDGRANWSLEFLWPKTAPPGKYRVLVYECRQNEVFGPEEVAVNAVQVGLPNRIAEAAANNASLYGLVCILIAVAAGFGMDRVVALFGGSRRVGH